MVKGEEISKVYIGADHAGFVVKEIIKRLLRNRNIDYEDLSAKHEEGDDYPDHAFAVAKKVAKDKNAKGILVCGTGAGMVIAANKVKGIRAVEAFDKLTAKLSREHNDANILTLGTWDLSHDKITDILTTWLNTKFSEDERHIRRLKKI